MKSVHVVEDDRSIAESIRMMLEDAYSVTVFETAAAMPRGAGPSLVITDLAGGDRYDSAAAIRMVRDVRIRTGAPVMVLTAHGAATSDDRLALVANAVLGKPFEMDELLATVERLAV